MPALVAEQDLPDRIGVAEQRAVGAPVADRHRTGARDERVELAEPAPELRLLARAQVLAREDQHGVLVEGGLDRAPLSRVECSELHAAYDGAERRRGGFDLETHDSSGLREKLPSGVDAGELTPEQRSGER